MEKVSADTITELTIANALPGNGPIKAAPTTQELIDQIRTELAKRVKSLAKSMGGSSQKNAFSISHDKALAELRTFERIVANPPKGFRLAPVLYSRISAKQNDKIYTQYATYVRRDFMRFLAENHADELSALGIAPEGIKRMKTGLDPVDASGRGYAVNVDHIIQRGGGGLASMQEEVDPQRPPGSKPTYRVNHFSNFILLPKQVHELKNTLNDIQDATQTPLGQNKWVLMLVPEVGPGHSGYVAQPQSQSLSRLHLYRMRPVQLAQTTAEQIDYIFESLGRAPEQQEIYEAELETALEDMSQRLETAFNDVSRPQQSIKPFTRFYESNSFKALRQKVDALPAGQAASMQKTLAWVDASLSARFYKHAANNNKKKANSRGKKNRKLKKQQHGTRHYKR